MPDLGREAMERYLGLLLGKTVHVLSLTLLGETDGDDAKAYGYGLPVRIDFQPEGEPCRSAVFHTMVANQFGHDHMSDRAQILLGQKRTINRKTRKERELDEGKIKKH